MTETTFTEQPRVRHLNEMLVVLYTDSQTYTFGTTDNLNNMLGTGNNQLAPQIEVSELQFLNYDRSNPSTQTEMEKLSRLM